MSVSKTIVTDLDRCIGCNACAIACKVEHGIDLGIYWNHVEQMGPYGDWSEDGKTPHIQMYWLPITCQQCENAPCIDVCPTGAAYRNEDGVVLIDQDACIGCQQCVTACPYGVRTYNPQTSVVEKCTLCTELTAQGEKPACVKACCGRARFYGDLDDPTSDAAMAIAAADPDNVHMLHDEGNAPLGRYILSEKTCTWVEEF